MIMVEVTKAATAQIAEYFKDKEVQPIRIFLNEGGWGGPSLAMALDEPGENDGEYDVDGYKYVVNNDFMDKAKPIKIDFSEYGFRVDSSIDLGAAGCKSCGTQDSCCSWYTRT